MWDNPIPLRPHHGLCLAFFIGHGYSEGFAAHMQELLERLSQGFGPDSTVPIQLTTETDAICVFCPNNQQGVCRSQEQVAEYDRRVLALCGSMSYSTFGGFVQAVQNNIIAPGHRSSICGGCEWEEICESHVSHWERG